MKKLSIYVAVLALFVVGGYFLLHSSSQTTTTNNKAITPEVATTNLIIDKSLSEDKIYTAPDDKYTVFKVTYPQFKNTGAEFNQKITDLANAGIAQQKKDSADNWQARYDTQSKGDNIPQYPKEADKFYFDVSWKPIQENNKFISIILTVSAFEGGAHGYETSTSYNYDVINKKEITLANLFPNDPNYLQTVSDFSRKSLEAQFRKNLNIKTKADEANFRDSIIPMLDDGTTPTVDNFNVFTFTSSAVTIYFNQYQVAPYAMGQSTVVIPRK